jgi:hypothetical protein
MQYEAGTHIIAKDEPAQPVETVGWRLNHLMLRIKVCSYLNETDL